MTIDEAIQHCEEVAQENERQFDGCPMKYDGAYANNGKSACKCAEEHRQLAEWLKELKALKEQTDTLDKIRAEIGMYEADCRLQGGTDECGKCNSNVFGSIYRIIDKYKAERSGEE